MAEFKAGDWCDVVAHPQGFAFVRQHGQTIICEVNGIEAWRVELDEPILYLRAACSPDGTVVAIGQGRQSGLAICTDDDGIPVSLGPTFGQNCTVMAYEDGEFVAYVQRSVDTYSREVLNETRPSPRLPIPIGPTSQGWLDVVDGEMVWTDPNRVITIGGVDLILPMTRGLVTVGQSSIGPDQITAGGLDGTLSTVIEATSWEPHIAALADGRFAICARTPKGAALAVCPPWPDYVRTLPPEGQPIPVPPIPPAEPLAVTISTYTTGGVAPLAVEAFYEVTGHHGPVDAMLTIDGRIVASSGSPEGAMVTVLDQPGEYRLGMTVVSLGRRAETGAVRIVRVHPRPEPPQPPVTPPAVTGKDAYTLAANEAREAMNAPVAVAPVLTIRGRQFYDGDRLYVPRWVSGLTLLARAPEQQGAFLNWAEATGFNGVRVFAGALTWAGQTPQSALAALPNLLDKATERGLAVEVTALTDTGTGYDMAAHVDGIATICAGRRNVVLEISNELGHSSQHPDLTIDYSRELGRRFAEPRGILWAVGATLETDEPHDGVYPAHGGTYATAHLDRGRETWNQVRRVREIYAVAEAHGAPAVNNEPIGADEKHGGDTGTRQRWNDPAMFFALGALDRAFGVGGVHHSQAGLMAELPGPVQQACADAYVAAHAAIDVVLPGIVGSYRNVRNESDHPILKAEFVEGGAARGVVRAYSFIDGDKGVTVLIGAKGDAGLQFGNGWRPVREINGHVAQDGRRVAVMEIAR